MPTTNYLWNDITDTVAMEKDGAGNTTAVYQSDPVPFGRLRSMRRGGTTYNYHYDGRGNTTYLTDQTGKKTDAYTYDAFGTQRTATGSTENPYRYGGQHGYQYNQATDDYYVRARVYQPKRGRWRSKDPLRFVDGVAPYLYVANEPTNQIDASGEVFFRNAFHLRTPQEFQILDYAVSPVAAASAKHAALLLCAAIFAKCTKGEYRISQIAGINMKHANAKFGPGVDKHSQEALAAINKAIDIYEKVPNKIKPPFGDGTMAGAGGKGLKSAIDKLIRGQNVKKHGVFLWVKVDCEICKTNFFGFNLQFRKADSQYWLCPVRPTPNNRYTGTSLKGLKRPVNVPAGMRGFHPKLEKQHIQKASKECVTRAVKEASCRSSSTNK